MLLHRRIRRRRSLLLRRRRPTAVHPAIEMAVKIAQAMEVSLDYLTSATDLELDNATLKRIQAVSKLPEKEKECVYVFLDSFIDRMKLQAAL